MKNKLFWSILLSFAVLAYGQRFVKVANNLAELALMNPNDVHTNAFVAGGIVSGDGNGGVFVYNKNSTTATTAVDVIKPVSYSGRWIRAIPSLNSTNGPGNTYLTINTNVTTVTNVTYQTSTTINTNVTTQVYNVTSNLITTNLFYTLAQRGTEQITGTSPDISWTNVFLKRWILSGNSTPIFSNVPTGTNEAQIQVDVVQPAGAAYTVSWPGVINWRKNSGYELLEQNTTNTFIFQWNGQGTSGWLVDGDSNSAFLASGGLVQKIGSGTDFTMQDDVWVDVTFASAMSVTITNNGPYAVYYSTQVGAANTQDFSLRVFDGTNTWAGTFCEDTTQSTIIPITKFITTNVTTAPVTLKLQAYNPAMAYPNAYVVSTNTVLGYHLLGGSGSGGINYTTITNPGISGLTSGYLPQASSSTTLTNSWLRTGDAGPGFAQTTTDASFTFNGPYGAAASYLNLTFDDYVFGVQSSSYIVLSSDDSTAANRTFYPSDPVNDGYPDSGQTLLLQWMGSNAGEMINDGAHVALTANWIPRNKDTITLVWDTVNRIWQEVGRTSATTAPPYVWGVAGWYSRASTIRTNFQSGNLSSGVTDLFTVPANYKFIATVSGVTTNSANASTCYVKRSGNYHRVTGGTITIGPTSLQNVHASTFVFNAADSLSVSNGLAGANLFVSGFLIPSSTPVSTYSEFAVDTTVKTLYTIPANTHVYDGADTATSALLLLRIINMTGSSKTYRVYLVPSGGSPSLANVAVYDVSIASTAQGQYTLPFGNPGDSVQVKSSTNDAEQTALLSVYEEPY